MPEPAKKARVYEPNARLIAARRRKYASPVEAAEALGVPEATYRGHENGSRGLGRSAERYAKFFGVSLEWLLTGRGSMSGGQLVEVSGFVAAGESVQDSALAEIEPAESVELPRPSDCDAYVVRGDSMSPRFFRGETLLFANRQSPIESLIGQICRIELWDGASYVKILRRGSSSRFWTLDSMRLYEPPIENVDVKSVYRWLALLPPNHVDAFIILPSASDKRRRRKR